MIQVKLIGCGAAGNKAAIQAIEDGNIKIENVLLVNSTDKDIPEKYRKDAYIYEDADGVGKEREVGKSITFEALKQGKIGLDEFLKDADLVVLVSSLDGGTGSSTISVFAKYIEAVLAIPVYIIGFNGFENDARSLSNSLEYLKELNGEFNISIISNKQCLDGEINNYKKAERKANEHFSKYIRLINAIDIEDSETNIDGAELSKLLSTTGYSVINEIDLKDIKSKEDFNKAIQLADKKRVYINTLPSSKRIGVFILADDEIENFIDYSFEEIKNIYGTPFEMFRHLQNSSMNKMFIIASGLKMPMEHFNEMYNNYKAETEKVEKSKDEFFEVLEGFKGDGLDNMFNTLSHKKEKKNRELSKQAFFGAKDITDKVNDNPNEF